MSVPGDRQVAVVEIAWPAVIQKLLLGSLQSRQCRPKHGLIWIAVPSALTQIPNYSQPVTLCIKPGCYPSMDSMMKAIMKAALGKKDGKLNANTRTNDALLTWEIDGVTRRLHINLSGIAENKAYKIMTVSDDLKSNLGIDVIIDCQSESRHGREAPDKVSSGTAKNVKQVGRWPVDLNAGSHTMFLYCKLVQNERRWVTRRWHS